jgi:hypothetical protein
MWKKVLCFIVLSQNMQGRTIENVEKPQSGYPTKAGNMLSSHGKMKLFETPPPVMSGAGK